MKTFYKKAFLLLLGGVFLSLVTYPFQYTFLAFIALVPLFLLVRESSVFMSIVYGFAMALFGYTARFWWIAQYSASGTAALILTFSLFGMLFGFCAHWAYRVIKNGFARCIMITGLWFFSSILFCLTVVGTLITEFGAEQTFPLMQWACIFGPWGLTFIVVLSNTLLAEWLTARRNKYLVATVAVIIVCVCGGYALARLPLAKETPFKAALIHLTLPNDMQWINNNKEAVLKRFFSLTDEAAKDDPRVIIWPLYTLPIDYYNERELALIQAQAKKLRTFIIMGAYIPAMDGMPEMGQKSVSFVIAPDGHIMDTIASLERVPLRRMRQEFASHYSLAQLPFAGLGIMICYDDVPEQPAQELSRIGASALVSLVNDQYFEDVAQKATMHVWRDRLWAVAHRRFVLRASSGGVSAIIDPYGKVREYLSGKEGVLQCTAYPVHSVTHFTRHAAAYRYGAEIFGVVCALLLVILRIKERARSKK
jgi:apolipoprotein N-acyltransferase